MAETDDALAALTRMNPSLPASRIRYHAALTEAIIREIRFGVLFFMAWWSSPARQAYANLARVAAAVDPTNSLEVHVANVDGCEGLEGMSELASALTSGSGETAWIADGRIVAFSGKGFYPGQLEPITRTFLAKGRR